MSNRNSLVHYRLPVKQYVVEETVRTRTDNDPVVGLTHFNESPITDECGNVWTTASGTPTISTSTTKFGTGSLYCGYSTHAYETVTLGGQDWTIDFWMYWTSTNSWNVFFSITGSNFEWLGISTGWRLYYPNTWKTFSVPSANAWHHYAFVYTQSSQTCKLYIDGVLVTTSGTFSMPRQKYNIYLGGIYASGTDNNQGTEYFDELRITDGVALWNSNFTPPTAPYSFTATWQEEVIQTPVTALLHFDESTIKDECGNTWTRSSNSKPVLGSSNGKFGSYLASNGDTSESFACNDDLVFDLTQGTLTIDYWARPKSSSDPLVGSIWFKTNVSDVTFGIRASTVFNCLYWISSTSKNYNSFDKTFFNATAGTWYHVAIVMNTSTVKCYVNGALKATYNQPSAINTLKARITIRPFANDFDELRISYGEPRWTEDFTPPTSPYTVVPVEDSSTVQDIKFYSVPTERPRVVLNGENKTKTYAALVEPKVEDLVWAETDEDVIALVPCDKIPITDIVGGKWFFSGSSSTLTETNAKFGKGLCFDSKNNLYSDYFLAGAADFTIDFWMYVNTGYGRLLLFSTIDWIDGWIPPYFSIVTDYLFVYSSDSPNEPLQRIPITRNTVSHWAFVYRHLIKRMTVYQNGTKLADIENYEVKDGTYSISIGNHGFSAADVIDEIRVTRRARWTANFTPPTRAMAYYQMLENPIASDIDVRFGTGEEDVKRLAKCKKEAKLTLSKSSITLSANNLSGSFSFITNSNGKVIVASSNPDVVQVELSPRWYSDQTVKVTSVSDSGSAIISVQIAESATFEESQVATCAVGNYIFGALNTCTPNEIQVAARLGIAPTTWSVGAFTADFTVGKFAVGGAGSKYWAAGSGAYKISYSQIYSGKDEHVRARIIGFNHNASYEGNNTIHFMMDNYANTAPMAAVDTKNYSKARQYSAAYTGTVDINANASDYNYIFTHHRGGTTASNKKGWTDSVIRTKLLPAFLNAMPSEWTSVMAYCPKYTYHPESSAVTSVSDKLFIPSEYEIIGSYAATAGKAHSEEYAYQAQYSLHSALFGASRKSVNYFEGNYDTTYAWALRSPCAANTTQYCAVPEGYLGSANDITGRGARVSLGVAPCFVIA